MLRIRRMTPTDIEFGMRVKTEAGWNQTRQDWQRFLALRPEGCFVALWDDRPAGTVTTCVFQTVAWIGMMLVKTDYRRRGIGRALMARALESLEETPVTSVRLDATPMGRPLYQTLGFEDQYEIIRFGGQPQPLPQTHPTNVRPMEREDFDSVQQLDLSATGVDRRALLEALFAEHGPDGRVLRGQDAVLAYLLSRPGASATQIGPCIARDEPSGKTLLSETLLRFAGQNVYVDVPIENHEAAAVVQSGGLEPLRPLTRMCRGLDNREHLPWLWSSSGPEKG